MFTRSHCIPHVVHVRELFAQPPSPALPSHLLYLHTLPTTLTINPLPCTSCTGVRQVLAVLGGEDEEAACGPAAHWLEWAVAQAVHVRPNLQAQVHLRGLLQAARAARPFDPSASPVLGLLHDTLLVGGGGFWWHRQRSLVQILEGICSR